MSVSAPFFLVDGELMRYMNCTAMDDDAALKSMLRSIVVQVESLGDLRTEDLTFGINKNGLRCGVNTVSKTVNI